MLHEYGSVTSRVCDGMLKLAADAVQINHIAKCTSKEFEILLTVAISMTLPSISPYCYQIAFSPPVSETTEMCLNVTMQTIPTTRIEIK